LSLQDSKDKKLLTNLIKVAEIARTNIIKNPILRKRPNEVGNDIEPYVKDALLSIGYEADSPLTKKEKRKAQGILILNLRMNSEGLHISDAKLITLKIFLLLSALSIYLLLKISE